MNDNARKLVEALRSGEFTQGQKRLRRDDAFCCLGVACSVYTEETGHGRWHANSATGTYLFISDDGESVTSLPFAVKEWLGFSGHGGEFSTGSLMGLNDVGRTFAEIADVIESEPEGLFA